MDKKYKGSLGKAHKSVRNKEVRFLLENLPIGSIAVSL